MSEQSKTKYVIVWVEKDCDNDIDDLGADDRLYDTEEEAKARFEPMFKEMCESTWADYDESEKSFEVSDVTMFAQCRGDYWTFQICPVTCKE